MCIRKEILNRKNLKLDFPVVEKTLDTKNMH